MMKQLFCLLQALLTSTGIMASDEIRLIVGTYTEGGSHGIYSYSFNQVTGEARILDSLKLANPSYLTPSADGRFIYSVTENHDDTAALSAIAFNKATGHMKLLNTQFTGGEDPCYVATNGKLALTANYTGGSMSVFPLRADGSLGKRIQLFKGHTGGPDSERQATAHVHCARFLDNYVLATDFSADQILLFRSHLEFSRDGRTVYLMSELSGNVTVFRNQNGRLTKLQVIASDTVGARGGADIHLTPDGRFLYSSNRLKADGIAIFKVDTKSGRLTRVGYQPTGIHPRNFNITPNGKLLLAASRDSNVIQVFSIDPQTGLLTDLHKDIRLSKPVCVKFI